MHPSSGTADRESASSTSATGPSISKRRHRVDSNPPAKDRRSPDPKRPRPEAAAATMSAKALGKRPAVDSGTTHHLHTPHTRAAPVVPTHFQPHMGARKLVIKNLKPRQDADLQDYYARASEELVASLRDIFDGRPPRVPMDRLYRAVENICRKGDAEELYATLAKNCKAHLHETVLPNIRGRILVSEIDLLRVVYDQWTRWSSQALTIRSLFSYMDRAFLLRNNDGHPLLNDMTIFYFRDMIFTSRKSKGGGPPLGEKLVIGMCTLVSLDRTGDKGFDRQLLQNSVNMLHVFTLYGMNFEPRLLGDSEAYFREFAATRSASSNLRDYIAATKRLLDREDKRCNEYNFDSTTKRQLMDQIHQIVIRQHTLKLLNVEDVGRLIDEFDTESLRALFELLQITELHLRLREPLEAYIVDVGSKIINDLERGDETVIRLLELLRKLQNVIRDAFGGDDDFKKAMRDAFGRFMNERPSEAFKRSGAPEVGEKVAKYIDMLLRGGLKALPQSLLSDHKDRAEAERSGIATAGDEEAELGQQLEHALELFRFIHGKDVFEAFYKRDLARRLLMGRSASQDAERSMLTKLKNECGAAFTQNLEQMFKDQELGKDELAAYKDWRQGSETAAGLKKVDLNVNVLSSAAWPSYPDEPTVTLPAGVAENLAHFENYYRNKHDGRKLEWKHSLSHCVIKATFPRCGVKELVVSAHQAAVLAVFNSVGIDEPLTYAEIQKASALTGDLLQRTLQSLACGKVRVLTKAPKGRDVGVEDTFTVNKGFTDTRIRIKINQIQLKETKAENRETHERVAADRQFETQAAIVRIMKSRKQLPHAQLVAEVIEQTRRLGRMDPADIKANIEKLIDKDYMERDGNSYTYVA